MLQAEEIKSNWDEYRSRVNTLFPSRADKLNKLYDDYEERIIMMPASSVAHYHNAFAGGYIDHVLRVMDCVEKLYDAWIDMGSDTSGYNREEMMFAAMHHDLGKCGFPGKGREVYQVETSDWHRKNMGRMYKHNENISDSDIKLLGNDIFSYFGLGCRSVTKIYIPKGFKIDKLFEVFFDFKNLVNHNKYMNNYDYNRSIYLLQKYDVKMSWNEYQAIRIHDGIYDDANKPYFIARTAQAKLKTNLPLILHHADHMAAQIEYEQWRANKNNSPNPVSQKTKATKKTAIKNLAEQNPDIKNDIADIFKTFKES